MTTLEWFGAATYRLRTNGLTIFLDAWLDKPAGMPQFLRTDEVEEADYIFISHAHFDHLPGADRIALRTGAVVIANGEAINCLRSAGVPEEQLMPVQGGERIPLFTKEIRDKARKGEVECSPTMPGQPAMPAVSLSALHVHAWPALHCLMPGISHDAMPDVLDTGTEFTGDAGLYGCTLDITFGMKFGLLRIADLVPKEHQDDGIKSMGAYFNDKKNNIFSHFDGGQMAFNFLIGQDQTLLWSAHLGAFEGIWRDLEPKPNVAILGIAGRGNYNGRPFNGSAAQFATMQAKWLGEPQTIIWTLQDQALLKPYSIDTAAATTMVEKETASRVMELEHATVTQIFKQKVKMLEFIPVC
ncbi:uncharacterized protein F5Z01DRAFT_697194 [Emericellopsis atlantica]|uniref:Metallo-beta-lactamase domain-containing protein n=1 Tax=Emericellopsis atlantica TaxID=2614577 RepID=A0A9P7ZRW2_9HYPO|nr:uncharacterized protein F5Z01DRAFT_697194 [Emericellopsis atlantica]KAG9256518.1 hypothetical protein F5Z01DRAFT_697194 [Emericellopsis atlantica]